MSTFKENQAQALWLSVQKGDRKAFDEFFEHSVRLLYAYGCQLHSDTWLVEDCIQELFIGLWQSRRDINFQYSTKQYLLLSLRRLILRKAGKKSGIPTENSELEFLHHEVPTMNEGGTDLLAKRKTSIEMAIKHLPKRQQEAIYLKYYENLDYEEVSEVMGLKIQGVYKLVSVGIKKLKNMLEVTA